MRDIEFRGQRKDNGEWVYGYYVFANENTNWIVQMNCFGELIDAVEVIPETVGQYLWWEINGQKVFVGDVLESLDAYGDKDRTVAVINEGGTYTFIHPRWKPKVIGNIHENPELIAHDTEDQNRTD